MLQCVVLYSTKPALWYTKMVYQCNNSFLLHERLEVLRKKKQVVETTCGNMRKLALAIDVYALHGQ